MTSKDLIEKGVQVVTFLLGAFNGFLKGIAPPDETGASLAVGFVSFGALVVFLFIMTLTKGSLEPKRKKYWLVAAAIFFVVFAGFSARYKLDRDALTFLWPPTEDGQVLYVSGGDQLTEAAGVARQADPSLTPARLVAGFGGIEERTAVWPIEAIRRASNRLTLDYILLFIGLSTSIFCLTEGILLRVSER